MIGMNLLVRANLFFWLFLFERADLLGFHQCAVLLQAPWWFQRNAMPSRRLKQQYLWMCFKMILIRGVCVSKWSLSVCVSKWSLSGVSKWSGSHDWGMVYDWFNHINQLKNMFHDNRSLPCSYWHIEAFCVSRPCIRQCRALEELHQKAHSAEWFREEAEVCRGLWWDVKQQVLLHSVPSGSGQTTFTKISNIVGACAMLIFRRYSERTKM